MDLGFSNLNWLAILTCVVVGQIFLTLWFVVLFGEQWAKAYGAASKKEHAANIPGYTYAIGLVCVFLLSIGLAILQRETNIQTITAGLTQGLFVALTFCIATALPGYAFLGKIKAFFLAIGSQSILILIMSVILAFWL